MGSADEVARAIQAVADGENPLGAKFPADDVEDLVAAMILFSPSTSAPDDAALELLGRLASRAGVVEADDEPATVAKVASYLSTKPPNAVLVDAVVAALVALLEQGAIDRASAFGRFVGEQASKRPVGGPRPEGAVRGGLGALLHDRTRGT